jgi:hypothetical protein
MWLIGKEDVGADERGQIIHLSPYVCQFLLKASARWCGGSRDSEADTPKESLLRKTPFVDKEFDDWIYFFNQARSKAMSKVRRAARNADLEKNIPENK